MDIDSIQLVIDVVRQASFAGAARQRDVDPSSVSRMIAAVEEETRVSHIPAHHTQHVADGGWRTLRAQSRARPAGGSMPPPRRQPRSAPFPAGGFA
ncbi:helix-turn-helix domain-containing protein [Bradyrhizobium guangxiense]